MIHTLARVAVVTSLAIAACDGASSGGPARWASVGRRCAADAPALSLPTVRRDSGPGDPDSLRSSDGRWARLARVVPGGWGGGLFLEDGVATMYLVDTARRGEAVAALNQYGVDGRTLGADLRMRQGRWSFAQLYDWYWYLNARLGDVPITSSDINEAENRLVYGVLNAKAVRQLEARLSALGVPCFLVAVEVRPYATPAAG